MGDVQVLETPVLAGREAARQLGMPESTLLQWLEGGTRAGRRYEPVLREKALGHHNMTWGELVEAQYLRAYRSSVSMQRLRPFLREMRQEFGVPYPLAHFRPYLDRNLSLIVGLQERANVPDPLLLVVQGPKRGHYLLNQVVQTQFLQRVDFSSGDDATALRFYPDGKSSPVVMDPELSSGVATVRGIRAEVLADLVSAGEHLDDVACEFDVTAADVRAACAHQWGIERVSGPGGGRSAVA